MRREFIAAMWGHLDRRGPELLAPSAKPRALHVEHGTHGFEALDCDEGSR